MMVRLATHADLGALAPLYRDFHASLGLPLDQKPKAEALAENMEAARVDIESAGIASLVADVAGELAGFVVASIGPIPGYRGVTGMITKIYVHPAYRMKGVGRKLQMKAISALENVAKETGARTVMAWTGKPRNVVAGRRVTKRGREMYIMIGGANV